MHRVKKNSETFFYLLWFFFVFISCCFVSRKKKNHWRSSNRRCLRIQFTTGFSTTDRHLSKLMARKSTYIGRYTLYTIIYATRSLSEARPYQNYIPVVEILITMITLFVGCVCVCIHNAGRIWVAFAVHV